LSDKGDGSSLEEPRRTRIGALSEIATTGTMDFFARDANLHHVAHREPCRPNQQL